MMTQLMQKIMLSCKVATELMEKKHRTELSSKENMQLFMHTAMCAACKQYEKQSLFLEQLFKAKEKTTTSPLLKKNTEKLEEKILRNLDLESEV